MPDAPPARALIGFDDSEEAPAAVRAAVRILRVDAAAVVTVWRPTASLDAMLGAPVLGRAVPVYRELDEIAADRAREVAEDGCALARSVGMEAQAEVAEAAHRARGLQHVAEARGCDVVVVGGRAEAGRHPLVHGSVAVGLLHAAAVPVLIVRGAGDAPSGRGPHLLAYDGCATSRSAIAAAGRLLRGREAVVAHVWLPPSQVLLWNPLVDGPGPLAEPAAMLDESSAEAARRRAEEGAELARESGFRARGLAVPSEHGAWRTLLRIASELDAATIVTGTHGHAAIDAVIGSVAEGVVRHAERPVLVVPRDRG